MSGSSGEEAPGGRLADLWAGTGRAVERLTDVDADDELEDLMRMLVELQAAASALLAETPGGDAALVAYAAHLREARDLLDDGEPAGRVAFEVMAARDLLKGRPQP